MYTDNKTVQILISTLKSYGVRRAVLSPGTRNVPLVHSIEQDADFECYSVVDERSASYFGLGLALEYGEPVVLSCTSGTAAANYSSAMWEANRQGLPLIAVTADRSPFFLNQLEDQMIDQQGMYGNAVRCSVTLPIVSTALEAWYCERLINEALSTAVGLGGGPVQINVPIEWGLFAENFNTENLPITRRVSCLDRHEVASTRADLVKRAQEFDRVLVMAGQGRPASPRLVEGLLQFVDVTNGLIMGETISNLNLPEMINSSLITKVIDKEKFLGLAPQLVITFGGNYVSPIKAMLRSPMVDFEHWDISPDGAFRDQFTKLSMVLRCSPEDFFCGSALGSTSPSTSRKAWQNEYRLSWDRMVKAIPAFPSRFSSASVMRDFHQAVPSGSLIHYGNGVAVHMAQYFPLPEGVETYCHSGTTTIDGSLSTFVGQASSSGRLSFAFIGDLSFFYDMNALWNRYVGANVRILLYNNQGGQTFHWNAAKNIENLGRHTSAEHTQSAEGWVRSLGFTYLSAATPAEFDQALRQLLAPDADQAIVLEVFTEKEQDAEVLLSFYDSCRESLASAPHS